MPSKPMPRTFKKSYVDTRMGQVHVTEAGRGPVLVLIPHSGRSARMYSELMASLADQFRVVAFDIPGAGLSDPPPDGEVSIVDLADVVVDAMDSMALGSIHLFGLHGGNKVGASIAARHSDRIASFVFAGQSHSIILSNARRKSAFASTPSISSVVSTQQLRDQPQLLWARQFRDLSAIWWDDELAAHHTVERREYLTNLMLDSLQSFAWRPYFYLAANNYDLEQDLKRITSPTLIIELATPKEDRLMGRQGNAVVEAMANARLHVMEFEDTLAVTLEQEVAEIALLIRQFTETAHSPHS